MTVPLFILANKTLIPKIEKKAEKYFQNEEQLNSSFETLFNNNHAARAMKKSSILYETYLNKNKNGRLNMIAYYLSDEKYNALVVNGILNICNALIYFIGGILVFYNKITAGELIALAIYFARIWSSVEFFLGFKKKVSKAKVSEKRIFEVLEISDHQSIYNIQEEIKTLSINNMSYSFSNKEIFDNLSFQLEQNKIYYLSGENGSGKTTLFDILSGIRKSKCQVTINGNTSHPCYELENEIFYVPSEIFLDDSMINEKVIHRYFPELDLSKDEFSAGEKRIIQICSIAERKENVLLLDEPLNYVDKNNIDKVIDMISDQKDGHIIIISSHNRMIQSLADCVLSIKNKQIEMK